MFIQCTLYNPSTATEGPSASTDGTSLATHMFNSGIPRSNVIEEETPSGKIKMCFAGLGLFF